MPAPRLRPLWNSLMLGALLVATPVAFAQPPIEQQMTPEQFNATGLDKLSPQELANLNAWLDNTLKVREQQVAAESAKAERERKQREAIEPVTGTLKGDFRGWENGTVLELTDGQRWRVVESAYYPRQGLANARVTIEPGAFGSWRLRVEGVSAVAKVKRIEP